MKFDVLQKKLIGVGAIISILTKFVHPFTHIREKYVNNTHRYRLDNFIVTGKETKVVSRREQVVVTFRSNKFENIILYAVKQYYYIEREGPADGFFDKEGSVTDVEVAKVENMVEEEEENNVIEQIANIRCSGEITIDGKMMNCGLVVENSNNPLPENYPAVANVEFSYSEWGHSDVCNRNKQIRNHNKPILKGIEVSQLDRVKLFKLMIIKDYLKAVILKNMNNNIVGLKVTSGELLWWLVFGF